MTQPCTRFTARVPPWLANATITAYALLLGTASLWPVSADSAIAATPARRTFNNLLHFPAYSLLYLLLALALTRSAKVGHTPAWTLAGSVGFGALMEVLQWALVPGRGASWTDMALNTAGAAAGGAIWLALSRIAADKTHTTSTEGQA